jgi:solute:Na+ symporter, SSS family
MAGLVSVIHIFSAGRRHKAGHDEATGAMPGSCGAEFRRYYLLGPWGFIIRMPATYVLQAISTVGDGRKAQASSLYTALLLIRFGIFAALVGMCAAVLFPKIDSLQAFPTIITQMDNVLATIVVAGLAGSLFGKISVISIGTATPLYKDFYQTIRKKSTDDHSSLNFVCIATVVVGLHPIPLAIYVPDVLKATFLAKSLRATLAILVLLIFYAPHFGTSKGAVVSILTSLVVIIGWFLAGVAYGIDSAHTTLVIPLIVMSASQMLRSLTSVHPTGSCCRGAAMPSCRNEN